MISPTKRTIPHDPNDTHDPAYFAGRCLCLWVGRSLWVRRNQA
jgi:hypothetical protein